MDRPSIIHLLGWTAGTALVLLLWRVQDSPSDPFRQSLGELMVKLVQAMAMGAAFGVVVMTVFRRYRGISFPTQPGQWYLLALGSGEALRRAFIYVLVQISPPHNSEDASWIGLGSETLAAVPYLVALVYGGGGVNWRAVFAMLVFFRVVDIAPDAMDMILGDRFFPSGARFWSWCFTFRPMIWLCIAVTSVAIDIVRKMQRGWLHNVGAAVLILWPCLEQAQRFIWSWMLPY